MFGFGEIYRPQTSPKNDRKQNNTLNSNRSKDNNFFLLINTFYFFHCFHFLLCISLFWGEGACCVACGILVPWPGMEPRPWQVSATGLPGNSLRVSYIPLCWRHLYMDSNRNNYFLFRRKGFPGSSVVKNLPANAGDTGLIPGPGRSTGGGNSDPLQHSSLGKSMDRGMWWAIVHGLQRVGHNLATEQQQTYL